MAVSTIMASTSKGKKTLASRPKRQRQDTTPAIASTFMSAAAADRFNRSVVWKGCIQERGFLYPVNDVAAVIQDRSWERFAAHPEASLLPVVREFYANAKEHRHYKALVRGKWVPFDSISINEAFHLPDIPNDEYCQMKDAGPDFEEIIQFLTKPGTEWKRSQHTVLNFPSSGLTTTSKVWHYFISARLMPSYHVSGVSKDRAVLNFAIQQGLSIDVGKVIHESICAMAQGKPGGGGYGHPSLVYMLCLKAGVPTSAKEEVQHPKPAITPRLIRRLGQSDEQGPAQQDSGNETVPARRSEEAAEQEPQAAPDIATLQSDIAALRDRMENLSHEQNQKIQTLQNHVECSVFDQRRQFTFFQEALQAIGSSCGAIIPTPPLLNMYPPVLRTKTTPKTALNEDEESDEDDADDEDEDPYNTEEIDEESEEN